MPATLLPSWWFNPLLLANWVLSVVGVGMQGAAETVGLVVVLDSMQVVPEVAEIKILNWDAKNKKKYNHPFHDKKVHKSFRTDDLYANVDYIVLLHTN